MAVFSTIRRNCTTQNLNILPDITYQDSNNSNTKLRLTSAAILSLAMHGSAFADHSEVPAGVALVGCLQSEIIKKLTSSRQLCSLLPQEIALEYPRTPLHHNLMALLLPIASSLLVLALNDH